MLTAVYLKAEQCKLSPAWQARPWHWQAGGRTAKALAADHATTRAMVRVPAGFNQDRRP